MYTFKCKRRTEADYPIWRLGGHFIHRKSQLQKKKAYTHENLVPLRTKKRQDRKAQWKGSYVADMIWHGRYYLLRQLVTCKDELEFQPVPLLNELEHILLQFQVSFSFPG